MKWKITIEHDDFIREYDIPFKPSDTVWYCYKQRKKYVVRKSIIRSAWVTNIVGVQLDNGEHIEEDRFDRLFETEEEAVDWCLKQNQRSTVKVYKE